MIRSNRPFIYVLALALSLVPLGVLAQPSNAPAPPSGGQPSRIFLQRFNDANSTHDGKLTMEQAKAGKLGWIVSHFSQVDTAGKGYITLADIQAYRQQNPRAATGAATAAAEPPGLATRERFIARFNEANATHDGKLTLDQAKAARLGGIVRQFGQIDAAGKGFVTVADIQAYRRQHQAAAGQPGAMQPPAGQPGAPPRNQAARQGFIERFQAANTSNDGRLTLAQASAGKMRWVATHFAAIDTGGRGYVTLADIQAYRRQTAAAGGGARAVE